jgi:hypothetical protein
MMKKILILFLLILSQAASPAAGNRYFTKTGYISFISATPLIDIEGTNNRVASFLDIKTGEMVFMVFIKDFKFRLALAEEHFNENYMYSGKYPQSKFKGKITNIESADLTKEGTYFVAVEGDLTIKDRTNPVKATGSLEVKDGKIIANSKFTVLLKDYNIEVPKIVEDKVAKEIPITIRMEYELYNK